MASLYLGCILLTADPMFLNPENVGTGAPQELTTDPYIAEATDTLSSEEGDDTVLVSEMRGLVLTSSAGESDQSDQEIQGVVISDLNVPGDSCELIDRLTPLIIGRPLTQNVINQLKREIIVFYRENSRPIMTVTVPEQDVTDGVLKIVVIEGVVGQIVIKGQRYFSECLIEKNICLECGEVIDTCQLLADVTWLNQNPFRQTNIVFTPGETEGTTNVELITKDRFPVRVYVGVDNTGIPETGRTRLFTGFNWGNAFWLDHILSFQWTTSDDFHKFRSYTGSYVAPLPWRHTLSFFGGYSRVRPHISGLRNKAWSAQASVRYKIPIGCNFGDFQQDLQIGYDFKETNNNLEFTDGTSAIETQVVQLGQFVGSYHLSYLHCKHTLNFEIDVIWSPSDHWFEDQTKHRFHKLQPGANPAYVYTQITFFDDYALSSQTLYQGWRLFYQGRLQLSNKILLPSEQFSLGGYDTVRGYTERIVNYDNAVCLNFELRTPTWRPMNCLLSRGPYDGFYGLVFVDYGYGWPHRRAKPHLRHLDPAPHTLLGVGPGVRYSVNGYLMARCDLGFPLTKVEGSHRTPHIHFSVVLSY